jgi:dsDNA-specific endonuclease/ATPase MutS2
MMIFNIGDKVSVLDDNMDGVVIKVQSNQVTIETTEGFELNFHPKELIISNNSTDFKNSISNFNSTLIKKEKEIPKPRSFVKEKRVKEIPPPEFDLHIEKLVKNFKGMTNYDILTLQSETAKRHLDFAIKNRIPKIVFIHGVGEGVLKSELDFMLARYNNIDFKEGNYQKYGLGATEIFIHQNVK